MSSRYFKGPDTPLAQRFEVEVRERGVRKVRVVEVPELAKKALGECGWREADPEWDDHLQVFIAAIVLFRPGPIGPGEVRRKRVDARKEWVEQYQAVLNEARALLKPFLLREYTVGDWMAGCVPGTGKPVVPDSLRPALVEASRRVKAWLHAVPERKEGGRPRRRYNVGPLADMLTAAIEHRHRVQPFADLKREIGWRTTSYHPDGRPKGALVSALHLIVNEVHGERTPRWLEAQLDQWKRSSA